MSLTKFDKRKVSQFKDCITSEQGREFSGIRGKCREFDKTNVHHPYPIDIHHKTFLGIFYNIFVKKVICNQQNIDLTNPNIDCYATIFPFRVDANISYDEPAMCAILDDQFEKEIASFLSEHFDSVDAKKTIKIFLTNIAKHRDHNKPANRKSAGDATAEEMLSALAIRRSPSRPLPTLNHEGIARFQAIRTTFEQIVNVFGLDPKNEIPFEKYDSAYFENLPETNFDDLYSLLDSRFYGCDRAEYARRFKKYLFFFAHASGCPLNPVFFVDDLLYECLKSLHTVKKSRHDPTLLKSHIAQLAAVFLRRIVDQRNTGVQKPLTSHLRVVSRYLKTLPAVRTGIVDYKTDGVYPENWIFLCTDDEAFDVCFSKHIKNEAIHFTNLIIAAALSPKPIRTLSIYNAYHGTKVSMSMPRNKKGIVDFVRKYNLYDGTKKAKPEFFLVEDFEGCLI